MFIVDPHKGDLNVEDDYTELLGSGLLSIILVWLKHSILY